jgi:hypothetical protein
MRVLSACAAAGLAGCAMASDVMNTRNRVYLISTRASAIHGGAAGADKLAYDDAQTFCHQKGMHAVVIDIHNRDAYTSLGGRAYSYGSNVCIHADVLFRCAREEMGVRP